MCRIDWAALGTWAAVVVALCIAVIDKVFGWFERRTHTRLLAVLIFPALAELENGLLRIEKYARQDHDPTDTYEALFTVDQRVRVQLLEDARALNTETPLEYLRTWTAINSKYADLIARAIASVEVMKRMASIPVDRGGGQYNSAPDFLTRFRKLLIDSKAHVSAARVWSKSGAKKGS